MHRQQCVPVALQGHRDRAHRLLPAGDLPAIYRRPDRLYRGRDTAPRDGYLLLDLLDLHDPESKRQHRPGRGAAGSRRPRRGPGRGKISQVLPVGLLHLILPSDPLLHPALPVEDMGGREDQDAGAGSELPGGERGLQERPAQAAGRVLHLESALAELLRVSLLPVRAAESRQRRRPDLLHRLLPGRRVHHLRLRGPQVHRAGARAAHGSHVPGVPEGDQVHIPQVWCVRHGAEVRWSLRAAAQHRQREDLRVPLVLVHHPGGPERPQSHLSRGCPTRPQAPDGAAASSLASVAAGPGENHQRQVPDRRLVCSLSARQEHRSPGLQAAHRRPRHQAPGEGERVTIARNDREGPLRGPSTSPSEDSSSPLAE